MITLLFALLSLFGSIVSAGSPQISVGLTNDLHTCSILDFQLPGIVSFPGSDTYDEQTRSYWASNQGELAASCRVTPRVSEDVQKIMFLISETNATFAIRSGGHSVVANSSNVADGVVIDLELLNHVRVRPDLGIVDVGAGARWGDIYWELNHEASGLHVAGARAGSVGVGGYLLGGGISVFAGTHGWACDQIQFFEIVLANGTLLDVNEHLHTDLFKALKGGGSNFGIVTRFGLKLIQSPNSVDFAFLQCDWSHLEDVVKALTTYSSMASTDPKAAVSVSIGTGFNTSRPAISVMLSHEDKIFETGAFAKFFEIACEVTLHEPISQLLLGMMIDEMNSGGYRQYRSTTTIYSDSALLTAIVQNLTSIHLSDLAETGDDETRLGVLIQPLAEPHLRRASDPSNIMGLENEVSPLIMLSMEIRYTQSTSDSIVTALVSDFMAKADSHAAMKGLAHSFRYLNYASANQQPFKHIRERNDTESPWPVVQAVKRRYDAHSVFQRQIHDPFRIQPLSIR